MARGRFYSAEKVAEMMDVTVTTVWRWLRSGKLKGTKIGKEWRIRAEDFEALFDKEYGLYDAEFPTEEEIRRNQERRRQREEE